MLPLQFIGQNIHFAIYLFAALVFFAVFWLHFDAWASKRNGKDVPKWIGFLLVSLSFIAGSSVVEQSIFSRSLFGDSAQTISVLLRVIGFAGIIIGLLVDPLQKKPDLDKLLADVPAEQPTLKDSTPAKAPIVIATKNSFGLIFALPVGALAIALLYWRHAIKGLERHLLPLAAAFLVLSGFELTNLGQVWQDTDNPNLFNIVRPFGPLWIASHVLLFTGSLLIGRWVWKYLVKRFRSQLFMLFITMTMGVFLVTTVGFSFLLMRNIQSTALENLEKSANVLNYSIDSKKAESQTAAELIAQNPVIVDAAKAKNHAELTKLTASYLASKKQSTLVITSDSGQVLLRAEDPDRWGDSISSDTQVRRALIGSPNSTVAITEGVLAPNVQIKTAVPIRDTDNTIVGAAISGLAMDNTFVDAIKQATGLDSAIYGGNIRAATTFIAPDGKSRWVGVKENNARVNQVVLKEGKTYKASTAIQNRQFLTVYLPVKDVDNTVVGMLFVGQLQSESLKTASRSIELTFLLAAILLILAAFPSYFFARYLSSQLE